LQAYGHSSIKTCNLIYQKRGLISLISCS